MRAKQPSSTSTNLVQNFSSVPSNMHYISIVPSAMRAGRGTHQDRPFLRIRLLRRGLYAASSLWQWIFPVPIRHGDPHSRALFINSTLFDYPYASWSVRRSHFSRPTRDHYTFFVAAIRSRFLAVKGQTRPFASGPSSIQFHSFRHHSQHITDALTRSGPAGARLA